MEPSKQYQSSVLELAAKKTKHTQAQTGYWEDSQWPGKRTGLQGQASVRNAEWNGWIKEKTPQGSCSPTEPDGMSPVSSHVIGCMHTLTRNTVAACGSAMWRTNGHRRIKKMESERKYGAERERIRSTKSQEKSATKCCKITAIFTSEGRGWRLKKKKTCSPPASQRFVHPLLLVGR